jgi:exodeoxyribonuclease V alpha subunit
VSEVFAARRAIRASGLLRAFNEAGVLAPADVHVARRLAELAGVQDDAVRLATALAVRGPRLGHVYVDVATIHETATVDAEEPVDLTTLPWPDPPGWLERLRASPLVDGPLRLEGSALYLDRLWREERQIAADLLTLRNAPPAGVDAARLEAGLARLLDDPRQAEAAATAVRRRFAVIAGGPGTGKTTTVARLVALLLEQGGAPLVALAAPTGKAAARLAQAVHDEAAALDVAPAIRDRLTALDASTLHRLLGWRPGAHSRFRHDRHNRLPHDAVIVDETSMVSLSLMARLIEAVRPDARLVLVGDPGQLTSIEAGAVLGDIAVGEGVVTLDRVHRFGGAIAGVADAIRRGDGDATVAALRGVTWIEDDDVEAVRREATAAARAVVAAARAGRARAALDALGAFRLLCAHRRGPHGVAAWTARVEGWLASELADGGWYAGRPLLVTENDYGLGLYNGDTGVVIATGPGAVSAAFERHGAVAEFSPSRLGAVDTVYAMTVHKSQGSQFGTAAVVLPEPDSPLLTRELLYTAVTRARERLILVGSEAAVRAAVARPVARASGLRALLRR